MVTKGKRDKYFAIVIGLFALPMLAAAQIPAKTVWLDYLQSETKPGAVIKYAEEITGTSAPWKVNLFTHPDHQLVCTYYYSDLTRKIKDGVYLKYHANGNQADSGFFYNNRKHGLYKEWYDNGSIRSFFHYTHDMPTDTCSRWNKNGQLTLQMICDENGNGQRTDYYENGKVKGSGKIRNGQQHQRWKFLRENGQPLMDVSFYEGEAVSTNCYDDNGNETENNCFYSKPPIFPGGPNGWMQFINEHLTYPEAAKRKSIEGLVKIFFDVDVDGRLSNFDVVVSPDPLLANEVIRLLKTSPAWAPAFYLNQPVVYRHNQEILFKEKQ